MTDRSPQQVACDGIQRVWPRQEVVQHALYTQTPLSMDGVIASRTLASVASEIHRRDVLRAANPATPQGERPLAEFIKTMDGVRLPLLPVRA